MALQYDLSLRDLMDFFCGGEHQGFSQEAIQTAEARLGVRLPPAYWEFLAAYGEDPINTRHNRICPPDRIFTSYELIKETIRDWEPEFREALQDGSYPKYQSRGNKYFQLWQLPMADWAEVTENYVLIWTENQGVWHAGYLLRDLLSGQPDPPVYISTDDDYVTFQKCADSTGDFLREMLRQAANGYRRGARSTKPQELEAALDAAGIDLARLRMPRQTSSGSPYFSGTCLDAAGETLYFYYEADNYRELTAANRKKPTSPCTIFQAASQSSGSPLRSKPEPCRLLLTPEQERDLGMHLPKKPGGIALHPMIALAVRQTFGRVPATAYDWSKDLSRMKTLKLQLTGNTIQSQKVSRSAYLLPPGDHFPPEPYYFDLHDWSAIGHMPALRTLVIEKIYVDDFSFLTQCKHVQKLSLYGTNFSDCRLLLEMPHLKEADLRFCPLEHEEVLETLPLRCMK